MENSFIFIQNEKKKNEDNIFKAKNKISDINFRIEQLDRLIDEVIKNTDSTHDIFSPVVSGKNNSEAEIKAYEEKKREYEKRAEDIKKRIAYYEDRRKKIDEAINDIKEKEKQMYESAAGTKRIVKKEKNKVAENLYSEFEQVIEYSRKKTERDVKNKHLEILKNIENKLEDCEKYINDDKDRAIMELKNALYVINEDKKDDLMFHVKHYEGQKNIYDRLSDFIKEYSKENNIETDFNYIGSKIMDDDKNIVNIIRIIQEAINNSSMYSGANKISVDVIVEKYDENENIIEEISPEKITVNINGDKIITNSNNSDSIDNSVEIKSSIKEITGPDDLLSNSNRNDLNKNKVNQNNSNQNNLNQNNLNQNKLNQNDSNKNKSNNDDVSNIFGGLDSLFAGLDDIENNDSNKETEIENNKIKDNNIENKKNNNADDNAGENVDKNTDNNANKNADENVDKNTDNNANKNADDNTDKNPDKNADNTDNNTSNSVDNNSYNRELKKNTQNMHRINFEIKSERKYRVNVKISDNGKGFVLENDDALEKDEKYGIIIMKYRAKMMDGIFSIESNKGFGTEVTLVYDIIR